MAENQSDRRAGRVRRAAIAVCESGNTGVEVSGVYARESGYMVGLWLSAGLDPYGAEVKKVVRQIEKIVGVESVGIDLCYRDSKGKIVQAPFLTGVSRPGAGRKKLNPK